MDINALVSLFVYVIVLACILGIVLWILSIVPIPEPFKGWIRIAVLVLCGLVVIFWLLSLIGGGSVPFHLGRR